MDREILEDKRDANRHGIVRVILVVIGTSGCLTDRSLRDQHKFGGPFSQVGFEEISLHEGCESQIQVLNISQERLLVLEFEVVLVDDSTQESPHRQGHVWPSGIRIVNNNFAMTIFDLSVQVVNELFARTLTERINIANIFDFGLRLHTFAIVFAIMLQKQSYCPKAFGERRVLR